MQDAFRQPGHRAPAPTPELREVQAFVNTVDVEGDADAIRTADDLAIWLRERGALPQNGRVTAEEHDRAIAIREGLRALGRINNDEPVEAEPLARMNGALGAVRMIAALEPGRWELRPATRGVDGYLGTLLGSVVAAMADGSWARVKSCRNDVCRWLFYDYSRNHSGTWCTMAICGSRMKARAYRSRRREAPAE